VLVNYLVFKPEIGVVVINFVDFIHPIINGFPEINIFALEIFTGLESKISIGVHLRLSAVNLLQTDSEMMEGESRRCGSILCPLCFCVMNEERGRQLSKPGMYLSLISPFSRFRVKT
jgi:hypothetical protein